ncbi:Glycolipid 2-alpha-mannosyltransferase [Verticillium dahliae VDG1]|nr:Glycolipid 2-alpha-mannosyltransferase [Verticillium dahliae VDG1]
MGNGVKKRKKATQALRALHPQATQSIYPQLRTMDPQSKKNIVIVGGGIIGSTTAYFLSRHPKFNPALHKITLLEATSIAAGASGKAGGLLALWAYPQPLVPLSYRLHAELAAEHGGAERWGVVYDATVSPYAVFTRVLLPEDYVPAHRVANCDDLLAYIATFSPQLAAARVKAKQACYLPQREGGPLIGATSTPGLWVAAGHTCWGIQNGPATGKLMAEYVMDGKTSSSDISEMDPRRYSRV